MKRNLGLDLLRGLCACAVAAYHFMYWRDGYLLASLGTFGVYLFFILSSLAMMMRYGDEFSQGLSSEELKRFYVARIARIIPLLAAVSVISYYYYGGGGGLWEKTILTGTGLMFLGLPGSHSIATGAWSLGIELAFYSVFPVIAVLAPRLGWLLAATAILIIAQQSGLTLVPVDSPMTWPAYTVPLTFAPFFALGIIIYRIPLRERPSLLYGGITLLACVLLFSLIKQVNVYNGGVVYLALMFTSAASVLLLYRASVPLWLEKPADFLGKISYSLYLTHWIFYDWVNTITAQLGVTSVAVEAVVFTFVALSLAYAVYALFEMPAQSFIKKLGKASDHPARRDKSPPAHVNS